MRVTGGEFRSRRLKSLPGPALRPTPDIVRQALFNVLGTRLEGLVFLDAYAGTGAVGIEALSRGASRAVFLEKSSAAVRLIGENLRALDLDSRATVAHGSATTLLKRHSADIVFLDPPYEQTREYEAALEALGENPPPLVLAQHDKHRKLAETYGKLHRTRELRHGDNIVSFYEP